MSHEHSLYQFWIGLLPTISLLLSLLLQITPQTLATARLSAHRPHKCLHRIKAQKATTLNRKRWRKTRRRKRFGYSVIESRLSSRSFCTWVGKWINARPLSAPAKNWQKQNKRSFSHYRLLAGNFWHVRGKKPSSAFEAIKLMKAIQKTESHYRNKWGSLKERVALWHSN